MPGRVLLTGATGLIGRQTVAPLLNAGYEVVAMGRRRLADDRVSYVAADLLDADSVRRAMAKVRASHLVHLAWHDAPQGRWTSLDNLDWAAATLLLMRAFAENGGTRAVAVGSCAEYDWEQEYLTETTSLHPRSIYGKSKAAAGTMLTQIAPDLGLSLAWARVFFCYGPEEPAGRLLGDLLHGIAAGRPVPCTNGLQMRDFMHTVDIGRALVAVLDSRLQGPVNVASGQTVSVKSFIETAAAAMGRPDLPRLGAVRRAAEDPDRLAADVSRLRSIAFKPLYDIETGVEDCVRAFRSAADRSRLPND